MTLWQLTVVYDYIMYNEGHYKTDVHYFKTREHGEGWLNLEKEYNSQSLVGWKWQSVMFEGVE